MKRNPIVIVTLLVLVLLTLPVGNLFAAGRAESGSQGSARPSPGTEVYGGFQAIQDHIIYLPLVLAGERNVPPRSTATPTATSQTPTPTQTNTPTPTLTSTATQALPPPAPPSELTATAISTDTIQLEWIDNSDTETEFIIEDSLDGVTYIYNDTTGAPDMILVHVVELLPNTYYCFRIFARNANGDSNVSNAACAATLADGPPAALTNLTAEVISPTRSLLTWTNNSFCDGYNIYESVNGPPFIGIGHVEVHRPGTYIDYPSGWGGYKLQYKVRAYNIIDTVPQESPDSNTSDEITLPFVSSHQLTRFNNNTVYPVVSLEIDEVEQFPAEPQGILPGGVYQPVLPAGSHSYRAVTGFWSYGTRTEMYVYSGTFTQEAGATGVIPINDPSIAQILTRFGSSAYYVGDYWGDEHLGSIFHSKGFCFNSAGTYNFYWDGVYQGLGTYSIGSYPGNFQLTFNTSGYQNYEAKMDERGSHFYMKNGPVDWPVIQYNYAGSCPTQ